MKYNLEFSRKGISNVFGRLDRINRKLKKELLLSPDDIVLNIGCDIGGFVNYLHPFCKKIFGIDINMDAITRSQNNDLVIMDARRLAFPNAYFTKIVTSMTIEHISNLRKVFEEINRVLKPEGFVVLHYPWELFRGAGTMRNAWIFYKNPFKGYLLHVNKLSHKKIERLIIETDLEVFKKKMFFDPQLGYITILRKRI